jgi:hypothetical protein
MSAFITVLRAKKLKNFPQPDIGCGQDAGADAKLRRVEVDLPEQVMKLAARFVFEAHVNDRIGVSEQVHCLVRPADVNVVILPGHLQVGEPAMNLVGGEGLRVVNHDCMLCLLLGELNLRLQLDVEGVGFHLASAREKSLRILTRWTADSAYTGCS